MLQHCKSSTVCVVQYSMVRMIITLKIMFHSITKELLRYLQKLHIATGHTAAFHHAATQSVQRV